MTRGVRKLLVATVLALPAAGLFVTSAQAETWRDPRHNRSLGFEHSGGHRTNSGSAHEPDRRYARDRHHAVRRHHSWWGFAPVRRHHDGHR